MWKYGIKTKEIRGWVDMLCWYCSTREAESAHVYKLNMFGAVNAKSSASQTKISYDVRYVEIPRCSDCATRHKTARYMKTLSAIFALVATCAAVALLFNLSNPIIYALILGLAVGLVLTGLIASMMVQKGIKTIRASRHQYPEIIELNKQCYRFGHRPKQSIPETDPPCDKKDS